MQMHIEGYETRIVSKEDIKELTRLCLSCSDYYDIAEGIIPDKEAAIEILESLPQDKTMEDKFVIGLFHCEKLISIVEVVKNYPVAGEWIIGLLLVDKEYRKLGIGKKMNAEIAKWVKEAGGIKLRIGVIETNINGLNFWSKIGYYEIKRTEPKKMGNRENAIIVMNYDL